MPATVTVSHGQFPGYWKREVGNVLRPAIWAYLHGRPLRPGDTSAIRAYFRQWIDCPAWRGPAIEGLRQRVDQLHTREAIAAWLDDAIEAGVDPL